MYSIIKSYFLYLSNHSIIKWLTPGLAKSLLRVIESLHYRCVRLVIKDYRQRVSREVVDRSTNSLPPTLWMEYSVCNLYINAKMSNQPARLLSEVESNLYTKRRQQGVLFGYDNARTKATRQRTRNWLGQSLSKITAPWTQSVLSKDQIRVLLTTHLYPSSWRG